VAVLLRVSRRFAAVANRLDAKTHPQLVGDIVVDGTGVGQLFRDAQLRQKVQNQMGLHLQFTRKDINADLLHKQTECMRGDT
jgi:hypothetical protein